MQISKTLYIADRSKWRAWLKKNYKTESEIWLVYYRKESGKPRIPYNDAVEEALCFGWIDSTVKKIDEKSYAQRFSPRKPKSSYSQLNKERLVHLAEQGKVMPEVLKALGDVLKEEFAFPPDIIATLKKNKAAWQNFQKFPERYKRIRVAFIEGARGRSEEFQKRLNYFIKMTEKNKQFGYGGVEGYYK